MDLRRHMIILALVAAGGLAAAAPASAADLVAKADQVKAVFLKRFIQFVDWPDESAPVDVVTVGVVGDGDFGAEVLDLAGDKVGDWTLAVTRLENVADVPAGIHVVVVCPVIGGVERINHPRWKNLGWLKDRPILTVGDDPDFMDAGGTFGFYLQDERVRFAARRHTTLQISSKLLRLAKSVD